jgi:hypothetical protein
MSRAPAPMFETTSSVTDTTMANPYSMHTYGMPAPMHGAPMMGAHTNSALHSMQNMYGSMHLQSPMVPPHPQLASPAHMHGMAPTTTQNVSVVDFKPDTMVNSQIAQLHHEYQNKLNSMMPTPGLGLIGRDGQYVPATAATAYAGYDTNSYMSHPAYPPRPMTNDCPPRPMTNDCPPRSMARDFQSRHTGNAYQPRHTDNDFDSMSRMPFNQQSIQTEKPLTKTEIKAIIHKQVDSRVNAISPAAPRFAPEVATGTPFRADGKDIIRAAVESAMIEHKKTSLRSVGMCATGSPYENERSSYSRY